MPKSIAVKQDSGAAGLRDTDAASPDTQPSPISIQVQNKKKIIPPCLPIRFISIANTDKDLRINGPAPAPNYMISKSAILPAG